MRAGPKSAPLASPLPFRSRAQGARRLAAFGKQFLVGPKGKGGLGPLVDRPWQVELTGSVWPARPRLAAWMLPRGQGKSTLAASFGIYEITTGEEGASVVVGACDERQASIILHTATRM